MGLVAETTAHGNGLHRLLDSIGLFHGLDAHRRRDLLGCVELRHYRRGEALYLQGEASHDLMLLMSGTVLLYRGTRTGRRVALAPVRPPGVLGEEALAERVSRTASAEALAEAVVLALPNPALLAMMRDNPSVCDAARRWLAERLCWATELYADHMLQDLPSRVAKTLLRLAERNSRGPMVVHFSQSVVASLAGGSRQSVNQFLQQFAGRGWLRIEKARIVLADLDALRRRAGHPPESRLDKVVSAT